jgi:hypothetical protein
VQDFEELTMLPWTTARAALVDLPLRFRILVPPYPALGVGVLRALLVRPLGGLDDGAFELIAGYEGYERI